MAHREVNLTKRISTPNGLRYCPVATSANGRVKPDVVIVEGKEQKHTEGAVGGSSSKVLWGQP